MSLGRSSTMSNGRRRPSQFTNAYSLLHQRDREDHVGTFGDQGSASLQADR